MMRDYEEIIKRCRTQNINIDDYDVYIYPNNFNGNECLTGTLSKDKQWICIPEKQYMPDIDDYDFIPVCHEIVGYYDTYLKGCDLYHLAHFYLLYKREDR